MTCKDCEMYNNNNNTEITSIINVAKIEMIKITDSKNKYLDAALESYYAVANHVPLSVKKYPFIRILKIDNNHEVYNGCLLMSWIIKKN